MLLLFYKFHDHVAHFVHFTDAGEADGALGKSGKRIGDAGFGQGGKLIERVRVRSRIFARQRAITVPANLKGLAVESTTIGMPSVNSLM